MNKTEMIIELKGILDTYQQLKAENVNTLMHETYSKKVDALTKAIEILETESNTSVSYK